MSTQKIGRYEIIRELGRGGMATVYLARDPSVNRQVAVKVLPPQFTHDPQFRARFEREAQVIAGLEHTYIVPVYDFGQEGDMPFIVMRYLSGGTLDERLDQKPMPFAQAVPILQRIAAALDTAHQRGIIHRDLKPGNILFDAEGGAYLSDFGIAKIAQETSAITGTGIMIGTPEYMSPEQAMGQRGLDHHSDIYTLGVIAYEMLTGHHPYEADTPVGLMLKHVTEPVPSLDTARYGLPADCNPILARALAKKPADRFASAGDFVKALTTMGTARPTVVSAPARSAAPPAGAAPPPLSPPPPTRAHDGVNSHRALGAGKPEAPPAPVAPIPQTAHAHHNLKEIPCSNCGGAGLELQNDGQAVCRFCGTANLIGGEICPECGHVNALGAEYCESCQQTLIRYCPACQTKNWSGLDNCAVCGQQLDALAYLNERWQLNTPEAKQQQLQDVRALKASEDEAAQRRMAKMMEQEQRRQKEIHTAAARRAESEKQIMTYLAIGLVAVVVMVIIIGVLFVLASPK